eukprot:TRINITY_DN4520_c0_g4_i2.p1 TRINITY_DN4520_c0_g4~~TRINITY_DN4520_c0_g4_i2.p1  ORF type:complete len:309 (-),score=71.23 TRINITY_DN4520_c0_g4_i2:85-1011(-)
MCFSGEMSATFAALGLFAAWWVYSRTSNTELSSGIFFFFTMELLQAVQYYFIAPELTDSCVVDASSASPCETPINKVLTLLGFLHICLQPYFCHVINASLTKSCKYKDRYRIVKRLCLIGGFLLFLRYFLSFIPSLNTMDLKAQPSTEWLRGNILCTFKSKSMWHLGWSVPMADPSYYVMGASIHSFLMFAPFFALYEKKGMILQGVFLFAFGPFAASLISDNLMEQASIWCFFSIAQISIMLFLIRETLIINWGRGNISVFNKDVTTTSSKNGVNSSSSKFVCRDFLQCEYCKEDKRRFEAEAKKAK